MNLVILLAEQILFACMADVLMRESRHAYHRKHRC
jgi:hypothetical protein